MRSIKILLIIFLLCILIAIGIVVYEIREEKNKNESECESKSESETSSEASNSTESTIIDSSTSFQKNHLPPTQQNKNQATPIVAPVVVASKPDTAVANKPIDDKVTSTTPITAKVEVSNRCTGNSTFTLGDVSTKEKEVSSYDLDSKKSEEKTQTIQPPVNVEQDDLAKKAAASTKSTASGSRLYPRLEDDVGGERVSEDASPKYTEPTTVSAHKPTQLSTEPDTSHAPSYLNDPQTTPTSKGIGAASSITKEKENEKQKEEEKKEEKKEQREEQKEEEEQKNSSSSPELNQENGLQQTAHINEEEKEEGEGEKEEVPEEREKEKHLESSTSSFEKIDSDNEPVLVDEEEVVVSSALSALNQKSSSTPTISVEESESNASSFEKINSNDKSIKGVEAVATAKPAAAYQKSNSTSVISVEEEKKHHLETKQESFEVIDPVKESVPINKEEVVATTKPAVTDQNSGSTPAISAEDENKEEEHLETKEESFEMIDSNPSGITTDEKELVGMLNAIAKLNPDLPKVNCTKDKEIINSIIKNKDVVVVERQTAFSISKIHLKVTLWEVLNSVANGETSNQHLTMKYTRTIVIISYPKKLQQNPIIEHALLRYYGNLPTNMFSLTLKGFEFAANASIFNKYKVFYNIGLLILSRSRVYSSTLTQLNNNPKLNSIKICKNTVIDFDSKLDLSASKLFSVEIDGIDRKYIDPLLTELAATNGMKKISIRNINFMSTSALNSLTKYSGVFEFTLRNIVFDGSPDFSFLKKMDKLSNLTMNNILYSYTDEFKIEDLDKIKKNPEEYLRITAEPEDSSSQKQTDVEKSDDIVRKNKMVGESISSTNIDVDNKLYNDLGLCKLKPKNNNSSYYMTIQLGYKPLDAKLGPTKFKFILKEACISMRLSSRNTQIQDVINCLKYIDFPFTRETTINEIKLASFIKVSNDNEIMETISDKLFKYAEHNKIKKIKVSSIVTLIPMDMYRIIMFNSKMPTLEKMTLSKIQLTPTKTSAQNDDEKKALESYCTFIEKDSSYTQLHIVKDGNIMKIKKKYSR